MCSEERGWLRKYQSKFGSPTTADEAEEPEIHIMDLMAIHLVGALGEAIGQALKTLEEEEGS